jgi:hypothetical protein
LCVCLSHYLPNKIPKLIKKEEEEEEEISYGLWEEMEEVKREEWKLPFLHVFY